MTQVKYQGEYPEGQVNEDGKPYIEQYGEMFVQGQSVNVKDEAVVAKLAANKFFNVAGESDKDLVAQGADEAEKAESESLRTWLTDHQVPYRANASLDNLRKARADYETAQAKAQEA